MKIKGLSLLLLILILIGGFVARFYRFDNPVADWHSWRQAETSSVSRNFARYGFDILHPRMDNISNVQSGKDNPNGYFFVEFPIYNILQAGLFKVFGIFTIEEWGRLVSMAASVAAGLFLYLIVRKHTNETVGLFSALFYMFIPFNIYYGRTILPDTSMTMAYLGAIYFFDKWISARKKEKFAGKTRDYLLALFFTVVALLLKPHALFFLLPIGYLVFQAFGWNALKKWQLYFFAIVSVAPLLAWRVWMLQYPEGIPANEWLFNGNGIRFRPSFFRWIFYERLTKLISGYVGVLLLAAGLLQLRKTKDWLFFACFFLSSLVYVSVIATGNVQHDYYQIPTIPSIAILMALGSYFLWNWKLKSLPVGKVVLVMIICSSFYFGWNIVKDYFNINNRSLIAAGEAVQKLTPKDALVIVNYNGDSSAIYQTDRKGWASYEKPMPEMIKLGADYLVLINPSKQDVQERGKDYTTIVANNQYAIFDLHKTP